MWLQSNRQKRGELQKRKCDGMTLDESIRTRLHVAQGTEECERIYANSEGYYDTCAQVSLLLVRFISVGESHFMLAHQPKCFKFIWIM